MYYNKNGAKEHSDKFRIGGVSEGYDKKKSGWMFWLLAILVIIVIILIVWWFLKKGKKGGSMGYRFW